MRKRLTFALVGIALAAIVLVGAGVLGFAQIGAERKARNIVAERLTVLSELAADREAIERAGPSLIRLSETFGGGTIRFATVTEQREVLVLQRRAERSSAETLPVDDIDLTRLLEGEAVITRNGGLVSGLQILDLDGPQQNGRIAVLVDQKVETVAAQARVWFVLSAGIVLLLAAGVAALLARRFTAPILAATASTEAIAGGNFDVRIPVAGDDEIARLGHSINHMAADLERGRAAEQQFLLSVSHDLRTPLTAIGGYAEALRDGTTTDTGRVGEILSNHAGRLNRLVQDLLDLAKLDARQFRLDVERVDAASVAEFVVEGSLPQATEDGVTLRLATLEPHWVDADADRLAQVIGNLIDNAGKYAASVIDVDVSVDGADVVIAVKDDGPGIHPQDLPHLFERLYVTQQRPRRAESSSGLGLAIVRELTAAMNGSVHAKSEVGVGTTMTIRFPRADVSGPVSG